MFPVSPKIQATKIFFYSMRLIRPFFQSNGMLSFPSNSRFSKAIITGCCGEYAISLEENISKNYSKLINVGPSHILVFSGIINVCLAALYFGVGTQSGHMSLIADAKHSFFDFFSDTMCLSCMERKKIWKQLCGVLLSICIFATGFELACDAFSKNAALIMCTHQMSTKVYFTVILGLLSKTFIFFWGRRVFKKTGHLLIKANYEHNRMDILNSLTLAIGIASNGAHCRWLDDAVSTSHPA